MSREAELILNAFVKEAHNDIIDFTNVMPESLNMSETVFYKALSELEALGYITNLEWCNNGECLYDAIEIDTPKFKLHK